MDNKLKLRRNDAIALFTLLSNKLFSIHDIKCNLNETLSVSSAYTRINNFSYADSVEIGVGEIEYTRFLFLKNHKISDKDFAHVVLNMYHEQMHCIQKNELFRQSELDENITNQLIQDVACMHNPVYYTNNNYRYNANEIQAELYGIVNTHDYLCDTFSDVDKSYHESLILSIVNEKMFNSTYFVSRTEPFTSLKDVEQAFDR